MKSFRNKIIPLVVLVCIFAGNTRTAYAQEEFLIEAGKKVAVFAIKKLTAAAYDASCRNGKSIRTGDDVGNLICSSIQGAIGKDEEEFRKDMREGLKNISAGIQDIENQLKTLRKGQKELHEALNVVALAVDLIPGETEAHKDLVGLRGAWNDHFKPMINFEREFDHERNIAYAKYLIFNLGLERNLSGLNETMVRPNAGNKPPLIEQHFKKIIATIALKETEDLEKAYLLLSSIVESLMIEQARGEIMYAWASAILEAECANGGDCKAAKELPHKTDEFRVMTKRHRHEQLALFNSLVERMVLDRSNTHSIDANFLHNDAELIFASADLFTSIHLREGFGIRGRVISAGDSFTGSINIDSKTINPEGKARIFPARDKFDWWSKPQGGTVYKTVHFIDEWTSYDFADSEFSEGEYAIKGQYPWTSGPVKVRKIDLQTGRVANADSNPELVVEFGSFLAIARAGGAYAMMHNAWDVGFAESPSYANGTSDAPKLSQYNSGKVVYTSKSVFDTSPRDYEKDLKKSIERRQDVVMADGGKVTVHMALSPAGYLFPGNGPGAINADAPADGALIYFSNFHKFNINSSFSLETGLYFKTQSGQQSISWKASKTMTKPVIGAKLHKPIRTQTLKFKKGEKAEVELASRMKFYMVTSGLDETNWTLFTGIAPTEIYLTKD